MSDVFEPANAMRKHAESKARMVTPRELSAFLSRRAAIKPRPAVEPVMKTQDIDVSFRTIVPLDDRVGILLRSRWR